MRILPPILLLAACAVPWAEEPPADTDAVFPHADRYEQPTAHGADALAEGQGTCDTCHGEASTAAACTSCHDLYPHPEGWRSGAQHGSGLLDDTVEIDTCYDCHAAEGLYAAEQVGCTSCHASFPHPEGWAGATAHGAYALARGDTTAVCGPCHGADLGGGDAGVACTDCHADYPHGADWAQPDHHGAASGESCFDCHGEAGTGGAAGVACALCHAPYAHPDGWAASHLGTAARTGEQICLGCHAAGDGPSPMVARCATTCHGGAP